MPPSLPVDRREVVRAHMHDTKLFVLSGAHGTAWRDEALRTIPPPRGRYGRRREPLEADALDSLSASPSWTLAVLVGPGHDLGPLVAWARRSPVTFRSRVRFYVLPGADVIAAVEPWRVGVSPVVDATEVPDVKRLVSLMLNQLIDQIVDDHSVRKPPGMV